VLSFLTTTRRNCPHLFVESEPIYDDDNEALLTMEIVKEEKEEEERPPTLSLTNGKYFILLSTNSYLVLQKIIKVPSWGGKYFILLITNSSCLGFARNYQVPSWGEKYFILLITNSSYLGFATNYQVPSWGEKYFILLSILTLLTWVLQEIIKSLVGEKFFMPTWYPNIFKFC